MPMIQIHLFKGRTDEQKKALLAAVTQAAQQSLGAPLESIRVWIHEFTPNDCMIAGEMASELLARKGAPPVAPAD